jgi:hypothetical protein
LFENFREISLKRDLSNDTTVSPPLFSLVNTFKTRIKRRRSKNGRCVALRFLSHKLTSRKMAEPSLKEK